MMKYYLPRRAGTLCFFSCPSAILKYLPAQGSKIAVSVEPWEVELHWLDWLTVSKQFLYLCFILYFYVHATYSMCTQVVD